MIEPILTRAEQIRLKRIEEMKRSWVHTPEKNRNLWELSETEGVKARVEYIANVGRATHKLDSGGWVVEQKRIDTGLIFGSGLEVKGVEEKFFNYFKGVTIIKKYERI